MGLRTVVWERVLWIESKLHIVIEEVLGDGRSNEVCSNDTLVTLVQLFRVELRSLESR